MIELALNENHLSGNHDELKTNTHLTIRNTRPDDISKIILLQEISFPYLAKYGNIWHREELESHIHIFPQGQFVAVEHDGTVVGSARYSYYFSYARIC